jgi:glycosyltransferase involved in cell wall biosynthesis
MRKVYLRGRSQGGDFHSIHRELIKNPPDGYQILTGAPTYQKQQQPTPNLGKTQQLLYKFDRKLDRSALADNLWQEAKTLSYMLVKRTQNLNTVIDSKADLVYSSQQLMFAKRSWVVDFEYANALVDYGDIRLLRRFVQKSLASRYCKKILPWSDWAKRTLYRSLDCDSFREKIETVHFGAPPRSFVKKKDDDRLRLLFVGSTNLFNYLNFEWKGGFEVVDAFLELNKKYDNIELTMRTWVPPEIQEKCAHIPNIKTLSSPLSEEALANLYSSSDIFLFPSYLNLGMAILEAMSYELPVIAVNLYDIPEAVRNMKTGILLDPPPDTPFYTWNGAPNHHDKSLLFKIRQSRRWMVNQIVDKASLLIENGSLRKRFGREARLLLEQGEFSVKRRNDKLKKVFDEAVCAG